VAQRLGTSFVKDHSSWLGITDLSATDFWVRVTQGIQNRRRAAATQRRLAEKTSEVARVQDRLSMTQAALERSVNNLSNANFMQLEVRFNALAPIGQTIYHGLT
jgi:hypothetical protein